VSAAARPTWVSAFVDLPADTFDAGVAFWSGVTGYAVSASRGAAGEFATLVPPDAASDHLRVQRLGGGPPRIHLDLHVPDPGAAADVAAGLGAAVVHRAAEGYVVMRSPGGLVWCLVHDGDEAPRAARAVTWPGGHRSQVDQVCLDVPPAAYDAEVAFWPALTGWQLVPTDTREFARLRVPDDQALRWLVQRLDDDGGPVRAHLDLATDDHDAEVARHVGLGAAVVASHSGWTVLRDPAGSAYCITKRRPRA
jgi:hypothetical protein